MATDRTHKIRGTRLDKGNELKRAWAISLSTACEPLIFKDLEFGEAFIVMPLPGDNAGHGGLLNTHHVFIKIRSYENDLVGRRNCVRVLDTFGRDDYGAYIPEETIVIAVD